MGLYLYQSNRIFLTAIENKFSTLGLLIVFCMDFYCLIILTISANWLGCSISANNNDTCLVTVGFRPRELSIPTDSITLQGGFKIPNLCLMFVLRDWNVESPFIASQCETDQHDQKMHIISAWYLTLEHRFKIDGLHL